MLRYLSRKATRYALTLASGAAVTVVVAATATATPTGWSSNTWRSPTGNIACRYYPTVNAVTCQTDNDKFAVVVNRYGGRAYRTNYRYIPWTYTLGYGSRWTAPGFECTSRTDGMRCRSQAGHGFFISRDTYDVW
jgi:Family of unknown function (DUF6636)